MNSILHLSKFYLPKLGGIESAVKSITEHKTFNYYTPLLNSRSISTVMDLRLLNHGILRKFFFKINITPFGKKSCSML